MKYPGLGIIGCEKLSGMYGVNEGIIDGKGTGVRHIFYDGFDLDLVHSAVTLIKDGDTIYYGNRIERKMGHPEHIKPVNSYVEKGFCFTDRFEMSKLNITDRAFGFDDSSLSFQTEISDVTGKERTIEVYAYVILRPQNKMMLSTTENQVMAAGKHSAIGIKANGCNLIKLVEEGPTGFIYRLTSAILYDEASGDSLRVDDNSLSGVLLGKSIVLPAKGTVNFNWIMQFEHTKERLIEVLKHQNPSNTMIKAETYWENFLDKGHKVVANEHSTEERINLIAIKSAMTNGFVPADLTGHYYSDGIPSYYARDSMMVARAFLLSGHYKEAKEIILYLKQRSRKQSYEFYQRYNGKGVPSEGANNNVFHQLDSIGYFVRNIYDYYKATNELLVDSEELKRLMGALLQSKKKMGMIGPEGGVNEGVFGPAFITSSNMVIFGGVKAAIKLLEKDPIIGELENLNKGILEGIESTFLMGKGYQYGYVSYHEELVKKYDTPQYFGLLYGFEDTDNMRKTHNYLLENAVFFSDGVGYSEQEYHHGPWIFNTGACAEYAYCIGDMGTYKRKLKWMSKHGNQYGLMPEAISGDNENVCYINPLIWACAEFVATCHIDKQRE